MREAWADGEVIETQNAAAWKAANGQRPNGRNMPVAGDTPERMTALGKRVVAAASGTTTPISGERPVQAWSEPPYSRVDD